jgi:hypothetical protein
MRGSRGAWLLSSGLNIMKKIEQLELEAHRKQIDTDVKRLVEKYRAIFDWDVAEIDQGLADGLILAEIRKALDELEKGLAVSGTKIIGGLKSTHIDGRGRIRVPMDKSGYVDNKEPLPTYPRLDHRGPSRHLPTA